MPIDTVADAIIDKLDAENKALKAEVERLQAAIAQYEQDDVRYLKRVRELEARIPDPDDLRLTLRYADAMMARAATLQDPLDGDAKAINRVRATLGGEE